MTSIPVLTTGRLTLRGPDARDIAANRAFYASDRSSFVGGPKTAEHAWRQLAAEIGHWVLNGYGRWMVDVTETGRTVGMVGLWNPEGWPEPEIGWDLYEGSDGRGYATEAAAAARTHAYDVLGWTTAISLIDPQNAGSAAVARRLGARPEASMDKAPFGRIDIWRHPAPAALARSAREATA